MDQRSVCIANKVRFLESSVILLSFFKQYDFDIMWNFYKNEQRRNGYAPVKHYRSFQEIRIFDETNQPKTPSSIKRAQTI